MRGESVASLRGKRRLQRLPQQGTAIRKLYDALLSKAGHHVTVDAVLTNNAQIETLRTMYCCDIVRVSPHVYCLTGEWDGNKYIDYLKNRFEKGT